VIVDHPESSVLNSQEFARRCIGMIVHAFVRDSDLMGVARILDANAIEGMKQGADTSPAVVFSPGTGRTITVDGKPLLIEGVPCLIDSLAICLRGVWTRDGAPGVENTNERMTPATE
jgi:hypothetical protein